MKRALLLLLTLAFSLTAAGCGSASEETAEPLPTLQPSESIAAPYTPTLQPTESPVTAPAPSGALDVDLTVLSGTMVYAEVYAMLNEPDDYRGKYVRMRGSFAANEWDGKRYFACIVQDATACCAQGLEFELEDARVYPDDYPALGAEITVTGIFDTYWEEAPDGKSYEYVFLRKAQLE